MPLSILSGPLAAQGSMLLEGSMCSTSFTSAGRTVSVSCAAYKFKRAFLFLLLFGKLLFVTGMRDLTIKRALLTLSETSA